MFPSHWMSLPPSEIIAVDWAESLVYVLKVYRPSFRSVPQCAELELSRVRVDSGDEPPERSLMCFARVRYVVLALPSIVKIVYCELPREHMCSNAMLFGSALHLVLDSST